MNLLKGWEMKSQLIHKTECPRSGWESGRTDGVCSCPSGWPKYKDDLMRMNKIQDEEYQRKLLLLTHLNLS